MKRAAMSRTWRILHSGDEYDEYFSFKCWNLFYKNATLDLSKIKSKWMQHQCVINLYHINFLQMYSAFNVFLYCSTQLPPAFLTSLPSLHAIRMVSSSSPSSTGTCMWDGTVTTKVSNCANCALAFTPFGHSHLFIVLVNLQSKHHLILMPESEQIKTCKAQPL